MRKPMVFHMSLKADQAPKGHGQHVAQLLI